MTDLTIIADDFTGATDVAGLCARTGADVGLRFDAGPGAGAVSVNALKIRSIAAADAVAQASAVPRQGRVYWKYCSTFDSTPEGNIGPVADALMQAMGVTTTIHCPAFPENGRTVYKGHLFVGDLPMDESPMRHHPLNPMTDANLMRLLEPQVTGPVALITRETLRAGQARARAEALQADGVAHIIADAIDAEDLRLLGQAFADWPLLCGGSAFAAATLPADRASPVMPQFDAGAVVVLAGSCSAATREQVARYQATGAPALKLDPRALAQDGAGAALDWVEAHMSETPLLYATAEPDELRAIQADLGTDRAAALVEDTLAAAAKRVVQAGAKGVVVAGGETSGAVTTALDVQQTRIGPEIAVGVPICIVGDGDAPLRLALKSGNFGGPDFFAEAVAALRGS